MARSSPQAYAQWKEKQKMTTQQKPGLGHNSGDVLDEAPEASEPATTKFAKDRLKSFVERIERLEEEKKAIADDIRDVVAEAKGAGFDTKALRAIVKERKQDPEERAEQAQLRDTYRAALGMLA